MLVSYHVRVFLGDLIHTEIRIIDVRISITTISWSIIRLRHQKIMDQVIVVMTVHQIRPYGDFQVIIQSGDFLGYGSQCILLSKKLPVRESPIVTPAPIAAKIVPLLFGIHHPVIKNFVTNTARIIPLGLIDHEFGMGI
ncbi:hypothetical protein D3C73_1174610 [compost metagenome]